MDAASTSNMFMNPLKGGSRTAILSKNLLITSLYSTTQSIYYIPH